MKWLKTLILILAVLLAAAIGALFVNQDEIFLKFAIWQTPMQLSVFWWLLIAFIGGLAFGILNGVWAGLKRRVENRRLRQELARANAEVERLRDLTLQG